MKIRPGLIPVRRTHLDSAGTSLETFFALRIPDDYYIGKNSATHWRTTERIGAVERFSSIKRWIPLGFRYRFIDSMLAPSYLAMSRLHTSVNIWVWRSSLSAWSTAIICTITKTYLNRSLQPATRNKSSLYPKVTATSITTRLSSPFPRLYYS